MAINQCVSLDCYSKIPQMRWFLYSRNLFLTILEMEARSGCKLLVFSLLGIPVSRLQSSHFVLTW